jgi:hypothetical protein
VRAVVRARVLPLAFALALAIGVLAGTASTAAATDAGPGAPLVSIERIEELTGRESQHVVGSTVWIRPGTSGSFKLVVSASTPDDGGIVEVDFPPIATGWMLTGTTHGPDATWSQIYEWGPNVADPGGPSTIVAQNAISGGSVATFRAALDSTPPSGVSLVTPSTATRDSSAPVSVLPGIDTESGIESWQLRRRTSTLDAGTCGAWGAWTDISSQNVVGVVSNAIPSEGCVQYSVVVRDNVGNETVVEQDGVLRVDRTAPIANIEEPAVPIHGSVVLGGVATDAHTAPRNVQVMIPGRYSICGSAPVDASGRWSCTWSIGFAEVGAATVQVTVTDQAGNRTITRRDVTILPPVSSFGLSEGDKDRVPPVAGLGRIPAITWTDRVRVKPAAYDDRPGYLEIRLEQQFLRPGSAVFSPWQPAFYESEEVVIETRGETNCFRTVAIDLAGNETRSDPRCSTLPYDDVDLQRQGQWDELQPRMAWMETISRTNARGASLSIRMADTTPQLVVTTCAECGAVRVFHGSRVLGTYSLRSKKTTYRKLISLPLLVDPLSAPVKIVSLSTKPILIDGFVAGQ